jgi:serine/threonine protein kinase
MELVEGPTLSDRIAQGAIPLDEALPIARQIVEALEAAHDAGIIHRDLKPANIKLRPDGAVKVPDFGLAKLVTSEPKSVDGAYNSPTITTPAMTAAGAILGTAAYMSPEQAKGRAVDRRADVWAFGCVLYEMLTATRLFAGDDVSETLAAILRQDPDWSRLPKDTPASVQRLLRRCFVRDPRERLPDIGVARLEIDEGLSQPPATGPAVAAIGRRTTLVVLAAGVAGLVLGGGATIGWLRSVPDREGEPRLLQVISGEGIFFPASPRVGAAPATSSSSRVGRR